MENAERSGLVVASCDALGLADITERPAIVVAADSGLHAVMGRGWTPDCVVGDMDSVDLNLLAAAEKGGALIERHPVMKDESDLELALAAAKRLGVTDAHVVARDGGRLDHQFANLVVLAAPRLDPMRVSATIGDHQVWVVRGGQDLRLPVGSHLGIHAVGGPATVSTSGVAFPLDREVLSAFEARGIANAVVEEPVRLEVTLGVVLIVSSPLEPTG